ncbi:MAG TPA: ABC transporter permease [Rhodothermales bacterium]|nr:ABC transporter permease [Rhodothermales bacterium]
MLKNHLVVAARALRRQKGYATLNVVGLAVGVACCLLILLYVQNERAFDRHHAQHDRIYRLVLERQAAEATTLNPSGPAPLGPALAQEFPQIRAAVRFLSPDNPTPLLSRGDTRFYEPRFFFADPEVFDVFTVPFRRGDARTALQKPNTVVLTETTARRYFGDEDPVGKTLTFNTFLALEVTGVIADPPTTSTLQYDLLASFATLQGWLGEGFVSSWQNNVVQTYVLAAEGFAPEALAAQLPRFIEAHLGADQPLKRIHFQPLDRIHLYSRRDFGLASGGDVGYVTLLSAVALFILLIGCINVTNLATARALYRAREVGIRKALGATRRQLVQQFLGEAALLTVLALVVAVALVAAGLPHFDALIGRDLSAGVQNAGLWAGLLGIGLVSGLLSGSYPAFVLSAFQPARTLKGSPGTVGGSGVRKALVVVQFALSIGLIIGTGVVYDQLAYVREKNLGFEQDQVLVVPIRHEALRQHPAPLTTRLQETPGVLGVATASLLPGGPVGRARYRAEGVSEEGTMPMLWVGPAFVETLGMEVVAGRAFSDAFRTDSAEAFVLNEEAVRQLGWGDPAKAIGKTFELVGSKQGRVIGVVRDFHVASLHQKIEPVVMHLWPWSNYAVVRADAAQLPRVLAGLRGAWQALDPEHPFTYSFLNENFDRLYRAEQQLARVTGLFALLAVTLACLGLAGLAAFTAQRRTKEVGIRKVLGASVPRLVGLLSKDFVALVAVAFVAAAPLAYLGMQRWLEDFAYRVPLGPGVFLLAGASALVVALLTVGTQALRAATADPVRTLRTE